MKSMEIAAQALRKYLLENKEKVAADLEEMRAKSEGYDIFKYIENVFGVKDGDLFVICDTELNIFCQAGSEKAVKEGYERCLKGLLAKNKKKQKLGKQFDLYTSRWKKETAFSSSTSEITDNSAYRSIIGLGQGVIPFILEDLRNTDSHWFHALEALTGQNPIKESNRGNIPAMKADWLEWAEEDKLI